MLTIQDLQFQQEIVPLFDHVYNEYARDILLQWMSDRPASVEAVYSRQAILKGLIRQAHLFRPFAYTRTEFQEAHSYLREIGARERASFLVSRARRNRELGQVSNLYIFFYKIDQAWFRSLLPEDFPPAFQEIIRRIQRFFEDLDVRGHYESIHARGLSSGELPRLTRVLKDRVRTGAADVFWSDLFFFEACLSLAKGIVKHQFNFPSFQHDGLSIKGFYHPSIHNPVVNDIDISGTVTLITGPNMSGKSTLLKAVSLCVTLAHLGLAVPAGQCLLPWFDVIFVAINLNDDILSGYSHFMTEIVNLKSVVLQARDSHRCFAVFDELFRGTNPEDACVISDRTIRGLTQFKDSCFLISTHLCQLKDAVMANKDVSTHFIDCQLVRNKPVFTYTLRDGWSDLRIGQIIFEQEGLNELLDSRSRTPTVSPRDNDVPGSFANVFNSNLL